jgi:hypothetical protein
VGVKHFGDLDGRLILDLPESTDDVRKAGELERAGEMDGFADQFGGRDGGATGRQVGESRA